MNQKILYLDIDGVLLGKRAPLDVEIVLANHSWEFLEFCLSRFECYWLTTHCKDGDSTSALALLSRYSDGAVMRLAREVHPCRWKTLKTEVINLASDFYWIIHLTYFVTNPLDSFQPYGIR